MVLDKTVMNNPALFRAYMNQIKTVDLNLCEFRKERKCLTLASEYMGMPAEFYVKSHYTGKKVLFKAVQPGDPLWDEDGWDGEQCIYRPTQPLPNVEYMCIYNQY